MKNVELCRLLGEETRYRIVNILLQKNVCVCQMQDVLRINQVSASKHLARLRAAGIVTTTKEGQRVYYALTPLITNRPAILQLFASSHLESPYAEDLQALAVNQALDPIYVCPTEKRS
jgi:ArsR family transcriptional regulator